MSELQFQIVPFEEHHRPQIVLLMTGIAIEFPNPISPKRTDGVSSVKVPDKYWVAVIDNTVIGTVSITKLKNGSSLLGNMFLDRRFRGSGIAQSLLETVTQWAGDEKLTTIYLGTMDQFKAAQKFYERSGFQKIYPEALPADFPLNPLDDLFYKKTLRK